MKFNLNSISLSRIIVLPLNLNGNLSLSLVYPKSIEKSEFLISVTCELDRALHSYLSYNQYEHLNYFLS